MMTSLLTTGAPNTGGALFSARPTTPAPETAVANGSPSVTQNIVLTTYVPFEDSAASLPETEIEDTYEEDSDQRADPQQVLLPGFVLPVVAEAVKIAAAFGNVSDATERSSVVGSVAMSPDEKAVVLERAHATLRAVTNTPMTQPLAELPLPQAAAEIQSGRVASPLFAATQIPTSDAATGAEQAMLLLASQSQNSLTANSFAFSRTNASELVATPTVDQSAAARQSLAALLGERVHVQIRQQSEHAIIRLDPPSMGVIEIVIRHEAGNVQVQMRASNPEVTRQLHAIGDSLRQDLVQRQHGDVSVHVSDGSRDADARQRHKPAAQLADEPGRALSDADGKAAAFFFDAENLTS